MRALAFALAFTVTPAYADPVDPILAATAKGCALPVERLSPSQKPTQRALPDANRHYEPDDDGKGEEWLLQTYGLWVRLTDTDGDHKADRRSREIYANDDNERLDCTIEERWQRGRWHLVSTARFEGVDEVITTYRNDRPVHTERKNAIMQ
jgi:hypothetical protein